MKAELLWTPQAREELMDIYLMIDADSPTAAERWRAAMEERIDLLADYPRLGVRRPEIAPQARMLIHGVYLILYETCPNTDGGPVDEVEILSVVHGHKKLGRLV